VEAVVGDGSALNRGLMARNSGLTALHDPWSETQRQPRPTQEVGVNLIEGRFVTQGMSGKGV